MTLVMSFSPTYETTAAGPPHIPKKLQGRGIELERRVLGGAGILAVLLVVAHEGNGHAVYRLPVVQVGFAQGWAALAERGISLFQDVTVLWIDKPTDRGARGVHVDDAGVDVADFLSSTGTE